MERRLVAILAADVAGYSHLTELSDEVSTATLRSVLRRAGACDRYASRPHLQHCGGQRGG